MNASNRRIPAGNGCIVTFLSRFATLLSRARHALAIALAAALVAALAAAPAAHAVQYLSSIDFIVGGPNGNTSLMKGSLDGGPNHKCDSINNTDTFFPGSFTFHNNDASQSYHYRSFDLWNNGPQRCIAVQTEWTVADCGSLEIGVSLYLGSFNPNDPTQNLIAHSYNRPRDFFDVGGPQEYPNSYMHSPGYFHDAASQYHLEWDNIASAVVPALGKVVVVLDSRARSPQDSNSGLSCPINPDTARFGLTTTNLDTVPLSVAVNDSSNYEFQAGDNAQMQFYVSLSAQMNVPFTVHYATANGAGANPAIAGTDYTAKSGDLTFAPGETTKLVQVGILGNSVKQPDRTFRFLLSNPQPGNVALAQAEAAGKIVDDDLGPDEVCRITNVTGQGDLPVGKVGQVYPTVTMIANTLPLVDPDYLWQIVDPSLLPPGLGLTQTSPGANPSGDNKGVISGTPTKAGTYHFTVKMTCPEVQGDNSVVSVVVNQPMKITIEADIPPAIITLGDVTTFEGNAGTKTIFVPVTLSSPLPQNTVFQVVLLDGSASVADGDYQPFPSNPQFFQVNAGEINANPIPIVINGDTKVELDEKFTVELRSVASGTTLASATITILNDDAPPTKPVVAVPTLQPGWLAVLALLVAGCAMAGCGRRPRRPS